MVIGKGRPIRSAFRDLPTGAVPIGIGLVVLGVASFVFLSAAGRTLTPSSFAVVSVLWVLVNSFGSGLFLPLEQEVARAVSARRASSQGGRPVVLRVLSLGFVLVGVLAVICALWFDPLADAFFSGDTAALVATVAAIAVLEPAFVSRGALAANERFSAYGLQLGVDGALRAAGAVMLLVLGTEDPSLFGWVLVAAVAISVVVSVGAPRSLAAPGPVATWTEVTRALGLLLAASLLSQLVINAAPAIAQLLSDDPTYVGTVLASLVVARIPLLLFAAVQASLLPRLSVLAARGDMHGFDKSLRRILRFVAVFTAVSVPVLLVAGPSVIGFFFGSSYVAPPADLAAYGLSTGLFMVMLVLAQSLIAFRRYGSVAAGWASALAVLLLALALPLGVATRINLGLVASGLLGSCALLLALRGTRAVGMAP